MPKLESEVSRSVRALCTHADSLLSKKEYAFAISKYFEALSLIPDPKKDYKASTYIYTSVGETYWKLRNYSEAGKAFLKALKCVGGEQSHIYLRLGECLYECGETVKSAEYMCQAYMMDGEDAFAEEDPKYFEVIRYDVEGAPDDDEDLPIEGIDDLDDIYLVDSVLGDEPVPPEYEDEATVDNPDELYVDGAYDDPDDILGDRDIEYGTMVDEGDYFGGEDEIDEVEGEEYYEESPFRRLVRWFLDLFS